MGCGPSCNSQDIANRYIKTVAFIGPKKSGKSSIIYYLKYKQTKKSYEETRQIQQHVFEFKEKVYDLKDFPDYNYQIKADAFVYVTDNNNSQEVQELNQFLNKQRGEKPILLLLNKSDLSDQFEQIDDSKIQWGNVKNCKILKSCKNGVNIENGFEWLHQELRKN